MSRSRRIAEIDGEDDPHAPLKIFEAPRSGGASLEELVAGVGLEPTTLGL